MANRVFTLILTGLLVAGSLSGPVAAETVPTRYGLALLGGTTYDPDTFGISMVQGYALFDYESIFWWQTPPDDLRLRVEGTFGVAARQNGRAIAAVNMLAFKYLNRFAAEGWRPYVEGGIGVVYTDFQVNGQGLRVNFNPQVGAGLEWDRSDGLALQAGLRLHHISNAGLHEDNRGVNALLLQLGWLLP